MAAAAAAHVHAGKVVAVASVVGVVAVVAVVVV